mmetsp:Transcript_19600/g.27733  ORF Transcript_19600/g.27733 Transcript_19600/m.27733 type:complete len:325 (+) Transcript_19600:291-1265(+)
MASTTTYDSTFFDPFASQNNNKDHHPNHAFSTHATTPSAAAAGPFIPSPTFSTYSSSSAPSFAMPPSTKQRQHQTQTPPAGALVPYDVTQLQYQQESPPSLYQYNHPNPSPSPRHQDEISCITQSFSEDHGATSFYNTPTNAAVPTPTNNNNTFTNINKENQTMVPVSNNNYSNYSTAPHPTTLTTTTEEITGFAYDPRMSAMTSTSNIMTMSPPGPLSTSTNTNNHTRSSLTSPDVMNKQHPMHVKNKIKRQRRTTGAAVGGVVVGGLALGPVGMVLGGMGAAAATRKICKTKEKKQERAYEQQQVTKQALDPQRIVHAGSFA